MEKTILIKQNYRHISHEKDFQPEINSNDKRDVLRASGGKDPLQHVIVNIKTMSHFQHERPTPGNMFISILRLNNVLSKRALPRGIK